MGFHYKKKYTEIEIVWWSWSKHIFSLEQITERIICTLVIYALNQLLDSQYKHLKPKVKKQVHFYLTESILAKNQFFAP